VRCMRPCCRSLDEAGSLALDDVVRTHLERVLDLTGGKISGPGGAAEVLRLNPSTLRSKLERLGVPYKRWPRTAETATAEEA